MTTVEANQNNGRAPLNASHPAHLAMALLGRVAWADGDVSDEERDVMVNAGVAMGLVADVAQKEAHFWSANAPTWDEQQAAVQGLADLVNARSPMVTRSFLAGLVTWAEEVAKASGSVLGEAYRIDARERDCLDLIIESLAKLCVEDAHPTWERLLVDLDGRTPTRTHPGQRSAV